MATVAEMQVAYGPYALFFGKIPSLL
jgi:hypothetical protein